MPNRKHPHSATPDDSLDDAHSKKQRKRPSLSKITYDDLRETISSLPADPDYIDESPGHIYRLPADIHTKLYQAAWITITVYGDWRTIEDSEARRVRILEAYIVPLLSFFKGRLIDQPKLKMKKTRVSSRGRVEHEIFIVGAVLLIVVEVRRDALKTKDIAQILAELLAAAAKNGKTEGFENLKIRGILTNTIFFYFYTFDPATQTFSQAEPMVSAVERRELLPKMIPITNQIFSIIFTSYMEALSCMVQLSTGRGEGGDFEGPGSAVPSQLNRTKHPSDDKETPVAPSLKRTLCASTSHWERAYILAISARDQFLKPGDDFAARDLNYAEAFRLLRLSVLEIPNPLDVGDSDLDEAAVGAEALNAVVRVYDSEQ